MCAVINIGLALLLVIVSAFFCWKTALIGTSDTRNTAPTSALFLELEWSDPDETGGRYFSHTNRSISATAKGIDTTNRQVSIARITTLLNAHFAILPKFD